MPSRTIAEAIGRGVGVPAVSVAPEEAGTAFGSFIGAFFAMDMSSSSTLTQPSRFAAKLRSAFSSPRLGWWPRMPAAWTDGIERREHRGIRPDAQRQREHDGEAETWRP